MFQIYDGRESFYQWDLDRKLIVEDDNIDYIHFSNNTNTNSLVCEVYEEDGKRLVNVPNILLQDNFRISVYAFDDKHTKHCDTFNVIKRSKPGDYVYTEEELKIWDNLENRIVALENSEGDDIDLSGYATEEYVNNAIANIELPSASHEEWELVNDITTTEEVAVITISTDKNGNPFNCKKIKALLTHPAGITNPSFYFSITNNIWQGNLANNLLDNNCVGYVYMEAELITNDMVRLGFAYQPNSTFFWQDRENGWLLNKLSNPMDSIQYFTVALNGGETNFPAGINIKIWRLK